mgnify:FL=1
MKQKIQRIMNPLVKQHQISVVAELSARCNFHAIYALVGIKQTFAPGPMILTGDCISKVSTFIF